MREDRLPARENKLLAREDVDERSQSSESSDLRCGMARLSSRTAVKRPVSVEAIERPASGTIVERLAYREAAERLASRAAVDRIAPRDSCPERTSVERRRGKGERFSPCAKVEPKNGDERLLNAKRSTPLSTIGLRMRYFSSSLKETESEDLRLGLLDGGDIAARECGATRKHESSGEKRTFHVGLPY